MKKTKNPASGFIVILALAAVFIALSSCALIPDMTYDGKGISSIEMRHFGQDFGYLKVDFATGETLTRRIGPDGSASDYAVFESFDVSCNTEIINILYRNGLLDLPERLEGGLVNDASDFEWIITFDDGSTRKTHVSAGSDEFSEKMVNAKEEIYDLTFKEIFGEIGDLYKAPPPLNLCYSYEDGNTIYSDGVILVSEKYIWRKRSVGKFDFATQWDNVKTVVLKKGASYSGEVNLGMYADSYEIKSLKITSYDINWQDCRGVSVSGGAWFQNGDGRYTFDIEAGRIYVVTVKYKEGTARYAVSTQAEG